MVCECREGLGSQEYCALVREGRSVDDFMMHRCKPENFEIDQWCLQTTYQALAKAKNVYVYSPFLEETELNAIGITKIDDVQAAVTTLLADYQTVAVSSESPYVVGMLGTELQAPERAGLSGMHAAPAWQRRCKYKLMFARPLTPGKLRPVRSVRRCGVDLVPQGHSA